MILEEVKIKTDGVFKTIESPDFALPKPSVKYQDLMVSYENNNLTDQYIGAVYEMRQEQAEIMGFQRLTNDELVVMLMGEPHNKIESGDRQKCEYLYCHLNGSEKDTWGAEAEQFAKIGRKSKNWWSPPFFSEEIWRCQYGYLSGLKRAIPLGVYLRIEELKKLKLFSNFGIIAPMQAWMESTAVDPIVTASISRFNPEMNKTVEEVRYFVAQW